jgi:hypothetical protein
MYIVLQDLYVMAVYTRVFDVMAVGVWCLVDYLYTQEKNDVS